MQYGFSGSKTLFASLPDEKQSIFFSYIDYFWTNVTFLMVICLLCYCNFSGNVKFPLISIDWMAPSVGVYNFFVSIVIKLSGNRIYLYKSYWNIRLSFIYKHALHTNRYTYLFRQINTFLLNEISAQHNEIPPKNHYSFLLFALQNGSNLYYIDYSEQRDQNAHNETIQTWTLRPFKAHEIK